MKEANQPGGAQRGLSLIVLKILLPAAATTRTEPKQLPTHPELLSSVQSQRAAARSHRVHHLYHFVARPPWSGSSPSARGGALSPGLRGGKGSIYRRALPPDDAGDASGDEVLGRRLAELIFSLSSAYLRLIFTGRKVNCSFLDPDCQITA